MTRGRKTLSQTLAENKANMAFYLLGTGKASTVSIPQPAVKAPVKKSTPKSNEPSEAQILKSILHYLRVHPKVAWRMRVNSGVFMDGDRYIQANSQRGCADIVGMLSGGLCFAIEVKSRTGKVSQHQQEFIDLIVSGGGIAGVARSVDDVNVILGLL